MGETGPIQIGGKDFYSCEVCGSLIADENLEVHEGFHAEIDDALALFDQWQKVVERLENDVTHLIRTQNGGNYTMGNNLFQSYSAGGPATQQWQQYPYSTKHPNNPLATYIGTIP